MKKNTAPTPTPILTNVLGEPLKNNEISLSANKTGVDIHINTSKLAPGTKITAIFSVLADTNWSESKSIPENSKSLNFRVEYSLYKLQQGATATVKCSYEGVMSEEVLAKIVA